METARYKRIVQAEELIFIGKLGKELEHAVVFTAVCTSTYLILAMSLGDTFHLLHFIIIDKDT